MFRIKNKKRGFTLIEMMVSVTIFSIVTLIVSGAFIVLADIYRKVQSNRAVIDNLNLAMDTMTLQIREGQNYEISENEISFDEYIIRDDDYVFNRKLTYRVNDETGILEQCESESIDPGDSDSPDSNGCTDLTSSEIRVESMNFESQRSDFPSQVLIILKGVATNKRGTESEFLLQSTLSQRNINS